MKYKLLDLKHIDKSVLVDDVRYKALLAQIEIAKKQNIEIYKEALQHYSEIRRLSLLVWGVGKKEERYIRNASVPKPPTFENDLKRLERQRQTELAAIERRQKDRVYRQGYKARAAGAKGDLLAAGFVEWDDFVPYRAITERARLMEQVEGVWQRRQPIRETE